ncbi:MBL fold metallo-hydrolase [Larkinella sp. VNQ87]|uniref:MBL fold metallo-hydrolase n=1 Tax=Larkinella sp. VNQ87 TaxID=3400921 RepID=UPI003C082E68
MEAQTNRYERPGSRYDVVADVAGIKTFFVNVFFIGKPGVGNPWVLVDAGLPGYAGRIRKKAEELFGAGTWPDAIVLTHGHIDHVGSLADLLPDWPVPVYAHPLELPYLEGKASYPPPDPGIGGGLFSTISWLYPIGPTDFRGHVRPVPANGVIPELPGWQIIHTPGHSPGHLSLFRPKDRTLLAGDALITTNQNSGLSVATQRQEFHGPPAYFTCDWEAARESVQRLAELRPQALGAGHGVSVRGPELAEGLNRLGQQFERLSIPSRGRYVKQPAITDEDGIVSMPSPTSYYLPRVVGLTILVGLVVAWFWVGGQRAQGG